MLIKIKYEKIKKKEFVVDKYLGYKYKWGGKKLNDKGIDCSGLACAILNDFKDTLIQTNVIGLGKMGKSIKQPVIGSVLIFKKHCGVYIGNNKFIHSTYTKGTMIDSIGSDRWNKYFKRGFIKHISI